MDNFDTDMMKRAVEICKDKIITEASGNITLDNIHDVAVTGVDYISTGSLTKDVKAVDLSMRFD